MALLKTTLVILENKPGNIPKKKDSKICLEEIFSSFFHLLSFLFNPFFLKSLLVILAHDDAWRRVTV